MKFVISHTRRADVTARLAGRINGDLVRKGRVIGMPDVMIAAVALRAGIPVVTGNQSHFEQIRIAGYELVLENWRTRVGAAG